MSHWYHRQPTLLPGPRVSPTAVYLFRAAVTGLWVSLSLSLYSLFMVRDAALTPFQLVIVGVALEGSAFLCEVPTGVIADAISRRLSILIRTVLSGLGPAIFGLFPSFEGVIIGQLFIGVGFTFMSGAQEAWLADEVGEDEAARLYPLARLPPSPAPCSASHSASSTIVRPSSLVASPTRSPPSRSP